MAQVIRRHWVVAVLNLILLLGGFGLLVHHFLKSPAKVSAVIDTGGTANTPVTAPPVNIQTYTRIWQLREKLALRSADLAAIGCSQAQANTILSGLVSWVSSNSDSWSQKEQAKKAAESNLAEAQRQINVGPANDSLFTNLSTAQTNASSARQQFDQFCASASDGLSNQLSSSQQQVWAVAKSNAILGVPQQYRYISSLSAAQAKAATVAIYRGENTGLSLPAGASSDAQAAIQNEKQNMGGVLAAEAAVLPVPQMERSTAKPGG